MRLLALFFFCCLASFSYATETLVIGIAGGTGSGKTTLAHKIQEAIFEHSVLISQDFYYKDLSHLSPDARSRVNFDHPDAIDFDLMRQHILKLKEGKSIDCPQYDFITHTRTNIQKKIEPVRVLIVEGILLFSVPELRELLNWKIFIDTDDDVRLLRRMERDTLERGRDFYSIKHQYLTTVKPMHDAFVQPSKHYADIIIPKGGENGMALNLILSTLNEEIHGNSRILLKRSPG
jgi:uridine kinase